MSKGWYGLFAALALFSVIGLLLIGGTAFGFVWGRWSGTGMEGPPMPRGYGHRGWFIAGPLILGLRMLFRFGLLVLVVAAIARLFRFCAWSAAAPGHRGPHSHGPAGRSVKWHPGRCHPWHPHGPMPWWGCAQEAPSEQAEKGDDTEADGTDDYAKVRH
jgi:hypothetical protein